MSQSDRNIGILPAITESTLSTILSVVTILTRLREMVVKVLEESGYTFLTIKTIQIQKQTHEFSTLLFNSTA